MKELSAFFIVVNGQVESGDFPHDDLYVRYGFTFGPDWTVVDGVETGLSQIARKTPGCSNSVVWNFPVDISFKSTNAHGWPRMSVSVYGVDALGRDVVRGYGSVLVPTCKLSANDKSYVTQEVKLFVIALGSLATTKGLFTLLPPFHRRSGNVLSRGLRALMLNSTTQSLLPKGGIAR